MSDEVGTSKKPGILRVEVGKRTSSASVDFKEDIEPTSPQPSLDKLSVSFANENKKVEEQKAIKDSVPEEPADDDDDEYSASASAILEKGRKDSWRRRSSKRRRSSSPLSISLRRRSSVFTTGSGDSRISIEDDEQEEIFQNMRIHKEVVANIKYQPWPIQKKLRLVQAAKSYIKQHEGQIQERLAQRRSARDILARLNILLIHKWNYIKREVINLASNMIPWEPRIKRIESHFGTVVASYFTFLRWLFSVNVIIAVVLVLFLAVPEVVFGHTGSSGERKIIPKEERPKAMNFLTLWNFEGLLKYSPLFYGYYNNENENNGFYGKKLPLVYFMVSLGVYVYSFVAILRKMAVNSKQSKLSEKDDDCIFTWKMFTSWDFMIGNPETAHNRTSSIILGFKEALLEEAEKTREEGRNWKLLSIRIFTHFNVIWLLASSMYAVIKVVGRSDEISQKDAKSWWQQNELTVVITLIGNIYPIIFDGISYLEKYHPRKALRLQLARIMVLNLLNLYSFIFATFSMIHGKSTRLSELKENLTKIMTNIPETKLKVSALPTKSIFTAKPLVVAALILANVSTTPNFIANSTSVSHPPDLNNNYSKPSEYVPPSTSGVLVSTDDLLSTNSPEDYTMYNSVGYEDYHDELTTENGEGTSYTTQDNTTSSNMLTPNVNESCSFDCKTNPSNEYSTSPLIELTQGKSTASTPVTTKSEAQNNVSPLTTKSISWEANNATSTMIPKVKYNVTLKPTSTLSMNGTTEIDSPKKDLSFYIKYLDSKSKKDLHNLCWETMFGQELVKLTVMDLLMTVLGIIMGDFFRALFVRYMNKCWCWDLEKNVPQYADFKMAENILHLVNNQGMVWMGMFFSPGLPLINLLKLIVMMYMRSWAVLTCNIPHEVVFRASRSNNFYFALLLIMLFLCVLPVGYALVWIEPSWHCGPFSNYNKIYHLFTSSLKKLIPGGTFHRVLDYIASPAIVIPLLMLLILIIYYLLSLTNALREANDDLKIQLRRERTEERRKMFQIANKKRRGTEADSSFNKWCKMINTNSLRKISLDNSANAIRDDKNYSNNITNHVHEKQQGTILKKKNILEEPLTNKNTVTDGKNDKSISEIKFNREDSVTSKKSFENVPEIKIIKTDTMEENVNGELNKKILKPITKIEQTTVNIHETTEE
ncbi:transmembrane channel-like protein [Halyomorpha halys]|uniref:transmembrane channel-like protein n=1 Tax=Halyomorpha halys TaxID=286706 RepID=UPI0006D500BF|nr:transmembrane channel-like protein 2 [Halyomorpha halys]